LPRYRSERTASLRWRAEARQQASGYSVGRDPGTRIVRWRGARERIFATLAKQILSLVERTFDSGALFVSNERGAGNCGKHDQREGDSFK
jgi:hypothetical protein